MVHGTPGTFFVVVTLTSSANGQTPHRFRVTHVTESSSTAEDRDYDIPLSLEYAADVSSRIVLAASPSSDEDGDGLLDIVETDTGVYVSPTDTGTDPFDPDSDGDGLSDGDEVNLHGSDPLDADTDDDGFSDGDEVLAGSDPQRSGLDAGGLRAACGAQHQRRERLGRGLSPTARDRRRGELGGRLGLRRLAGRHDRHGRGHPRGPLDGRGRDLDGARGPQHQRRERLGR